MPSVQGRFVLCGFWYFCVYPVLDFLCARVLQVQGVYSHGECGVCVERCGVLLCREFNVASSLPSWELHECANVWGLYPV